MTAREMTASNAVISLVAGERSSSNKSQGQVTARENGGKQCGHFPCRRRKKFFKQEPRAGDGKGKWRQAMRSKIGNQRMRCPAGD